MSAQGFRFQLFPAPERRIKKRRQKIAVINEELDLREIWFEIGPRRVVQADL